MESEIARTAGTLGRIFENATVDSVSEFIALVVALYNTVRFIKKDSQ